MRKATLGALLLAGFAVGFGSPFREIPVLHRAMSILGVAGYVLLALDPPVGPRRQQRFLVAGALCALGAFLLAILLVPSPGRDLARLLAVASVALPLWPVAGPARINFAAAGLLALLPLLPPWPGHPLFSSLHAYFAAGAAGWVAWRLHRSAAPAGRPRRAPVQVLGAPSGIHMTPEERAARLGRIEARFQRGEIPEHVYWDLRQELESR